jgi:broad specificity phosphatase PhoE
MAALRRYGIQKIGAMLRSLFCLSILFLGGPSCASSASNIVRGAMVQDEPPSPETKITCSTSSSVIVRFYMVRHGETIANVQKIVVGQADSALSELGARQSTALGETEMMQEIPFWRRYASDLGRTQHTAKLINDTAVLKLDSRLREIAKGARQGYPKKWSYAQASAKYLDEKDIPLLETSEEAWSRIYSWIYEVMLHAIRESAADETASDDTSVSSRRNVLAVSHAGAVRLLLQKLVPDAHPLLESIDDPSGPLDDTKRFKVPNTSVTIVDIITKNPEEAELWPKDDHGSQEPPVLPDEHDQLWEARVVELTWTGHYDRI